MAARYTPTTDTGRAVAALFEEAIGAVELPPLARTVLPLLHGQIDAIIRTADEKPDETRAALVPLLERVAGAFGYHVAVAEVAPR